MTDPADTDWITERGLARARAVLTSLARTMASTSDDEPEPEDLTVLTPAERAARLRRRALARQIGTRKDQP